MAIQFHDRWDTTIPLLGGKSAQGWYYTPLETIMTAWLAAGVNAAARDAATTVIERVPTKWDGGDQFVECFEYKLYRIGAPAEMGERVGMRLRQTHRLNSAGTRRVMKCLFDGYHGSWLPGDNGEELTWWFMRQHLN